MLSRNERAARYIRKCERRRSRKQQRIQKQLEAALTILPPLAVGMLLSACAVAAML